MRMRTILTAAATLAMLGLLAVSGGGVAEAAPSIPGQILSNHQPGVAPVYAKAVVPPGLVLAE